AVSTHLWRRLEEVARLAAEPAIAAAALRVAAVVDAASDARAALRDLPEHRRIDKRLRGAMATLGATSYGIVTPRLLIASVADDVLVGKSLSNTNAQKLFTAARAFEGGPRFAHPRPVYPGVQGPSRTRVWYAAPVRVAGGKLGALVAMGFDAPQDF